MKNVFKTIAVVLCLFTGADRMHSQESRTIRQNYFSIGVKWITTGNRLAQAPALTVRYSFPKMDFDFGVNYQLKESRFTGGQANMCWYVIPVKRKVRLGFFCGVRYLHNASLKESVVAQERWKQPESNLNFDELKMRCLEEQIGFGLRIQHSQYFSTFYGIGAGAYQTLGNTEQYAGMHRPVATGQLTMNFGAAYSFR